MKDLKLDVLQFIFLLSTVYFFFVTSYMAIALTMIIIILFVSIISRNDRYYLNLLQLLFVTNIVYLLFLYLAQVNTTSFVFDEIIRLFIYILVLFIVNRLRISMKSLYGITVFFVLFGLTIQIIQFLQIFDITSILMQIYGESNHYKLTMYDSLSLFRSGGVYGNPNHYARVLLIFFVYLLYYHQMYNNSLSLKIILALSTLSIFFTGSRAAFLMLVFIILFTIYYNLKLNRIKIKSIINTLFILTALIVFTFFVDNPDIDLRSFSVAEGFDDSISTKIIKILEYYQYQNNTLKVLFGTGPIEQEGLSAIFSLDFDLGYLLVWYGVFGMLLVGLLSYFFLRKVKEDIKLFNYLMIIVFFGSILTSGFLLNIRIFPIFITYLYILNKE